MKTWPALVNEKVLVYQQKLIEKAEMVLANEETRILEKNFVIAGVPCVITNEQSAKMLISLITKEQEEIISINNRYNKLGLEREAIIKTGFFRKIVRKIDLMKDLFFFSSCDYKSSVWANMEAYENSIIPIRLNQLSEEIENKDKGSSMSEKDFQEKLLALVNMAKDILWEKHSDILSSTGKRRIKIQLLDAPSRTKDRLVDWKIEGFNPFLVCHRDAFIPSFIDQRCRYLQSLFFNKLRFFNKNQCIGDNKEDNDEVIKLVLEMIKPSDPIVYVEDGDWTVIIDQYADFPEEKQVIFHIKDHYSQLGKQFGVINEN
ncbi:hypothetical protein IT402_03170 [Candidatus Nomurabacteria bacterium]|nr:hypothetical protein [Candidatus Nomurabacteria bacterium]